MEFKLHYSLKLCGKNDVRCLLLSVGMGNKRLLLDDLMKKELKRWPVSSIILFIFYNDDSRKISSNESICLVNLLALFIVLPKLFFFFYLSHYISRPRLLQEDNTL